MGAMLYGSALLLALLLVVPCLSMVVPTFVAPSEGSWNARDVPSCGSQDSPCATIQYAAANSSSILLLAPGTYSIDEAYSEASEDFSLQPTNYTLPPDGHLPSPHQRGDYVLQCARTADYALWIMHGQDAAPSRAASLMGVDVTGCKASVVGMGAVRFGLSVSLTLVGCNFYENTIPSSTPENSGWIRGAAVSQYIMYPTVPNALTVGTFVAVSSSFWKNTVGGAAVEVAAAGTNSAGGAIFALDKCSLFDCSFFDNSVDVRSLDDAFGSGGAVYSGSLEAHNTVFERNRVSTLFGKANGGALSSIEYTGCTQCHTVLSGCTFVENTAIIRRAGADGCAGALAVTSVSLTVVNSTFSANSVLTGYDAASVSGAACGGAVFGTVRNSTWIGVVFDGNSANTQYSGYESGSSFGGALRLDYTTDNSFARFANVTFTSNSATVGIGKSNFGGQALGGALLVQATGKPVYVEMVDVEFIGNNAFGGNSSLGSGGSATGGALTIQLQPDPGSEIALTRVLMHKNEAHGGSGSLGGSESRGGAAALYSPTITIDTCEILENTCKGGSVENILDLSSETGRTGATAIGGGIYISNIEPAVITITDSIFSTNIVSGGDAFVALYQIAGSGGGNSNGGGLAVRTAATLRIEGVDFVGNQAVAGLGDESFVDGIAQGGGLWKSWDRTGILQCVGCNFEQNFVGVVPSSDELQMCKSSGGGAYISSEAHFESSNFSFNTAQGFWANGGGLVVFNDASLVESSFVGNTVAYWGIGLGGGVLVGGGSVELQDVVVLANAVLLMASPMAPANVPGGQGGGVAVTVASENPVSLRNVTVERNASGFGGGVLLASLPDVVDLDIVSRNNTASSGGGALFVQVVAPDLLALNCSLLLTEATGNSAGYGEDCASSVRDLALQTDPPEVVWPGATFPISLFLRDWFLNAVIKKEYHVTADPTGAQTYILSGVPQDTIQPSPAGAYDFPAFSVLLSTGTNAMETVPLTFQASSFVAPLQSYLVNSSTSLHGCPPGQFLSDGGSTCSVCSDAQYNFDGKACISCPEGGACMESPSSVDARLTILEGYFPSPSFVHPTELIPCNGDGCVAYECSLSPSADGSWAADCDCDSPGNDLDCHCKAGYTGRLCSACVFTEDICYYDYLGECQNFDDLPFGVWLPLLELAAYLVVAIVWFSVPKEADPTGYINSFTFYLQVSATLNGRLFSSPGIVTALASISSGVALGYINLGALRCLSYGMFSSLLSVEIILSLVPFVIILPGVTLVTLCWLAFKALGVNKAARDGRMDGSWANSGDSSATSPSSSLGGSTTSSAAGSPTGSPRLSHSSPSGPLLQEGLEPAELTQAILAEPACEPLLSSEGFQSQHGKRLVRYSWWMDVKAHVIQATLFLLYSSYFPVTSVALEVFNCRQDGGEGDYYLVSHPWLQCSVHTEWLGLSLYGIFIITVYVCGSLALFGYLLFRYRNRLEEKKVQKRFGFFYMTYKRELFWFEWINMLRRLGICIGVSLFAKTELGITIPIAVLCVCIALQYVFEPYEHKNENFVELVGLLLVVATNSAALLSDPDGLSGSSWDNWLVVLLFLLLNSLFILYNIAIITTLLKAELWPRAKAFYDMLRGRSMKLLRTASKLRFSFPLDTM